MYIEKVNSLGITYKEFTTLEADPFVPVPENFLKELANVYAKSNDDYLKKISRHIRYGHPVVMILAQYHTSIPELNKELAESGMTNYFAEVIIVNTSDNIQGMMLFFPYDAIFDKDVSLKGNFVRTRKSAPDRMSPLFPDGWLPYKKKFYKDHPNVWMVGGNSQVNKGNDNA